MKKLSLKEEEMFEAKKAAAVDKIAAAIIGNSPAGLPPTADQPQYVSGAPDAAEVQQCIDAIPEELLREARKNIRVDIEKMAAIAPPMYPTAVEYEVHSAPRTELRLFNAAIDALDDLVEGTNLQEIHNSTAITEAVFTLKNTRMMRFADLIDWNRLAEVEGCADT